MTTHQISFSGLSGFTDPKSIDLPRVVCSGEIPVDFQPQKVIITQEIETFFTKKENPSTWQRVVKRADQPVDLRFYSMLVAGRDLEIPACEALEFELIKSWPLFKARAYIFLSWDLNHRILTCIKAPEGCETEPVQITVKVTATFFGNLA